MKLKAYLFAYAGGAERIISIPDAELAACKTETDRLELAFYYGQNDFQPLPFPSLSVGDVVEMDGQLFRVEGCGWTNISRSKERDGYLHAIRLNQTASN